MVHNLARLRNRQASSTRLDVIIGDRPPAGAFKIIELMRLKRPEKGNKTGKTKQQSQRYEIDKHIHG